MSPNPHFIWINDIGASAPGCCREDIAAPATNGDTAHSAVTTVSASVRFICLAPFTGKFVQRAHISYPPDKNARKTIPG